MAHRVVILSPKGRSLCPSLGMMLPGVECEFVKSGYEAAAELLSAAAAPARALVIDFQALNERHLPLLSIARRQQVEIMGVGAFPPGLSSEHLSGMRLLGVNDLARAIESLGLSDSGGKAAAIADGARLAAKGQDSQFESDSEPVAETQKGRVL